MWFKGFLFLSYTALLVAPTNAAFGGQDKVASGKQEHKLPARAHSFPRLHDRQQPWRNQTVAPETPQESESVVPEPATSSVVVVTSDDPQVTSPPGEETQHDEPSSAINTEGPSTTVAPITDLPVPKTTLAPVEEPGQSSDVAPTSDKTSGAEQHVPSTSLQEAPSQPLTQASSAASSTPSNVAEEPEITLPPSPSESDPADEPISTLQPSSSAVEPSKTPGPRPSSTSTMESETTAAPVEISSSVFGKPDSNPTSAISPPAESVLTSTPSILQMSSSVPQAEPSDTLPTSASEALERPTSSVAIGITTGLGEQPPRASLTPSAVVTTASPILEESTTAGQGPSRPAGLTSDTSLPATPTQSEGQPDVSPTSGSGLPLISDIKSEANPVVSSVLDTSNVGDDRPTATVLTSTGQATQTGPDILETTAPPTTLVPLPTNVESEIQSISSSIGGEISSIFSDVKSTANPSTISGELPSALSDIPTTQTGLPVISTTEVGSIISSIAPELPIPPQTDISISTGSLTLPTMNVDSTISSSGSGLPIPSQTDIPISTGLAFSSTLNGNIPVSETLAIPTEVPTLATSTTDLVSAPTGISLPEASGTGLLPDPLDASSLLSSQVVSSQADPTTAVDSDASGSPTASRLATSSLSELTVSFNLFNTAAPASPSNQTDAPTAGGPTTDASNTLGLATSQGTQIPTSETLSNPTTTPLTFLPAPGLTMGISGSTNASAISPSGAAITSGPTAIISGPNPSQVDTKETSAELKVSVPTSESVTATATTNSGAIQSDVPSSTDDSAAPSNASTLPSDATTGAAALPTDNDSLGPSTTAPVGFIESKTVPPTVSSTTAAAGGGEAKPAPLSKSQTAGIAIGGTTCLLVAIVAALFLARRYHASAAKRKSTGSVYPEVAYLYDPPVGGNGDAEAGGGVPAMSGGASGYGAISGGSGGYDVVPQNSPRHSTGSVPQNPFRDPVVPSPQPSPRLNGYGGPVGDITGEYAALAINPYVFNPVAKEYPPMSPYGPPAGGLPAVPERASERYSDPFADPFEHDLLLNVDVRSETPESIVVMAPPPTPRSPRFPGRYTAENVSNLTLSPTGRYTPDGRYTPESSSSALLAPPGRNTPENTSLTPSSQTSVNNLPIAPPARTVSPPPTHKGWDNIKNDGHILIPAPLNLTPPIKKKPLPLRREPTLSGPGQMLLSGAGLPLTVKRKDVGSGTTDKIDRGLGLEVPSMSVVYGSPGPTIHDYSQDPTVRRKRSGELLFADPQLIGRQF